jgi:hypothetical protein
VKTASGPARFPLRRGQTYLLVSGRFLDLREIGITLLLPSLSLYASSMNNRSFLLRLKIFLELLSAQSSNWAKVKPNTSLFIDFFISSAPQTQHENSLCRLTERSGAQVSSVFQRLQAGRLPQDALFGTWGKP